MTSLSHIADVLYLGVLTPWFFVSLCVNGGRHVQGLPVAAYLLGGPIVVALALAG